MNRSLVRFLSGCLLALVCSIRAGTVTADFTRDLAKWQAAAGSDRILLSLNEGRLVVKNVTTGSQYGYATLPFSTAPAGNYRAEMRIRINEGPADRRVALVWTGSPQYYGYFEVQETGKYWLYDWVPSGGQMIRSAIDTSDARPGDFNTLAATVVGQRVFFSLNGKVLDALVVEKAKTSSIGFSVPSATTVEIESLSFTPITESDEALTALVRDLDARARESQKAAGVVPNLNLPAPFPFIDDFDGNETGWPLKAFQIEGEIREGGLALENFSAEPNSVAWISKALSSAIAGDYELSLTLKELGGAEHSEVGLVFDLDAANGRRVFQIGAETYRYYRYDGKDWDSDSYFSEKTDAVKKGGTNLLTVRVVGSRAFLLINGEIINAVDYSGPRGTGFGLLLSSGASAVIDQLSLRPLAAAPSPAVLTEWESKARLARISRGPKTDPFIETFDDNRNNWPFITSGDGWEATIDNGSLTWKNKASTGVQVATCPVPFNAEANFSICMRLRHVSGRQDIAFGLEWGRSTDGASSSTLGISGNGQWTVWEYRDGQYLPHLSWRPSTLVRKNEPNEIKVSRIDDVLFVFLNGEVVADLPFKKTRGDRFAAHIPNSTEVAFDEISVSYLDLSVEAVAAQKNRFLAQLAANHKKREFGAAYSVGLAEDRIAAEEARKPKKEDWEAADKLNRKYGNKSVLRLIADKGQPSRREGTDTNPVLYYFYKNIGGVNYYMEYRFINSDTGAKKLDHNRIVCISVGLVALER